MAEHNKLRLGCVADDFTGAGDIASFITKVNVRCLLITDVPQDDFELDSSYEAVVIALKTRSVPAQEAVEAAIHAFDWLRAKGATTLYFKYCSTFDSTPQGNIGPVLDALLERYHLPFTVLCPALPVNRRTVKDGRLYVDGVPLDESPMSRHPLNPMWDSRIAKLMEPQSQYPCHVMSAEQMGESSADIKRRLTEWQTENEHFYVIPDFFEESQGARIAEIFGDLTLLSGGSAMGGYLSRRLFAPEASITAECKGRRERGLILAGSCSVATLGQIDHYIQHGGKALRIEPLKLMNGEQTVEQLWAFVKEHPQDDVLLYSSASLKASNGPDERQQQTSDLLEHVMSELGTRAVASGIRRIIVAGGETSGAVISAIGRVAYEIGPSVAPGVPILFPVDMDGLQLVLKSGNFGQEDFFDRTLRMMKKGGDEHVD